MIPIVGAVCLLSFGIALTRPSSPKASTAEKVPTRAEVEAADRKKLIGGLVGGAAFIGFIAYAFVKWFKETDQVLTPVEHGDEPWRRI
jgi:hypothetical protein